MNHGMLTIASKFSVTETIDRIVEIVTRSGLTIFARINHATNAAQVGFELRPTELLIFGSPRGGSPLMVDRQTAGTDLPVSALAWQDEAAQVWLTYNDANWIAARHGLSDVSTAAVKAIEAGMAMVLANAAGN